MPLIQHSWTTADTDGPLEIILDLSETLVGDVMPRGNLRGFIGPLERPETNLVLAAT